MDAHFVRAGLQRKLCYGVRSTDQSVSSVGFPPCVTLNWIQTFAALGFVKTGEHAHDGYDHPTFITMQKSLDQARGAA